MVYRGHVRNGQITLDHPADLPEGAEVAVEVVADSSGRPAVWSKLLGLAGAAKGLPPDMARNHDHYLYGTPKDK